MAMSGTAGAQPAGAARALGGALRAHAGLAALVFAHLLIAFAVSLATGRPFQTGLFTGLWTFASLLVPVFLTIILVYRFATMAVAVKPASPLRWMADDIRRALVDPERLLAGLTVLTLLSLFISSFSFLKIAIPDLVPFGWDPAFTRLDGMLHFGVQPWRILQPVLGYPSLTTALNSGYNAWFFVMFFMVFLAAFAAGDRARRLTFLYAFVLSWALIGNLLALVFSSAGPVYFERLGYGADFAPLMAYLRDAAAVSPVWALKLQDKLWQSYASREGLIAGISAMPSMHVATAVLLALQGFAHGRVWGWLLTAFALIILIGSVHLGWHYAIDGYAGGALALAVWPLARRLAAADLAWQRRAAA